MLLELHLFGCLDRSFSECGRHVVKNQAVVVLISVAPEQSRAGLVLEPRIHADVSQWLQTAGWTIVADSPQNSVVEHARFGPFLTVDGHISAVPPGSHWSSTS